MSKLIRMLTFLVLVATLGGCTYVGFSGGGSDSDEWPAAIENHDFIHARELAILLADSAIQGKVQAPGLSVSALGAKGVVRFKDLDLVAVKFKDGRSLVQQYATMHIPLEFPPSFFEPGGFILTGYLDQSDGRHLDVRMIVEGSQVSDRFLFEARIDRFTGESTEKVDGVGINK